MLTNIVVMSIVTTNKMIIFVDEAKQFHVVIMLPFISWKDSLSPITVSRN